MKWEHKIVVRGRNLARPPISGFVNTAADNTIVTGGFEPSGEAMLATLQALGQDEWELVGISTRSSQLNSPMTTEEVWVLKRPVS